MAQTCLTRSVDSKGLKMDADSTTPASAVPLLGHQPGQVDVHSPAPSCVTESAVCPPLTDHLHMTNPGSEPGAPRALGAQHASLASVHSIPSLLPQLRHAGRLTSSHPLRTHSKWYFSGHHQVGFPRLVMTLVLPMVPTIRPPHHPFRKER